MDQSAATQVTVGTIAKAVWGWLKKNLPMTILMAAIGAAAGWFINVYTVAVRNEGFQVGAPTGASAATSGNLAAAGRFWAIGSIVVFGIFGYWRSVGTKQFFEELVGLPKTLLALFQRDGASGRVHLLWGFAISLLAAQVIRPSTGALMAIGLLAAAPSVIGRALSGLTFRIWSTVTRTITPSKGSPPGGILAMTVGIIGGAGGLLVAFLVQGGIFKLLLAAACAGGAVLLSRTQQTTGGAAAVLLGLVGAGVLLDALRPLVALADDGGWIECGSQLRTYVTCPGTSRVLVNAALGGAVPASIGAPVGWAVGNVAGSTLGGFPDGGTATDPGGPPEPGPDGETITLDDGTIQTTYPDGTVDTRNPDGTVERVGPDGSATRWNPDGNTEVFDPNGTSTVYSPDGNVTTYNPDGSVEATAPDGTTTRTTADGGVTEIFAPDGTATRVNPDGSQEVFNPDGSLTITAPDGSTQTYPPGEAPEEIERPITPRYRELEPEKTSEARAEPAKGEHDPDKGHTVDPDRVAEGPDGKPLVDPHSGEPLKVDTEGRVKYGDEWLTPQGASDKIKIDTDWQGGRAAGQQLVDDFKDIMRRLNETTDPETRAKLEAELRAKAVELNSSYQGKAILKAEGRSGAAAAMDAEVTKIYGEIDPEVATKLTEMGIQRGGRDFSADDLMDIRNASSAGTVGMDRDLALDESKIRDLQDQLSQAKPGSKEATELTRQLAAARAEGQLTLDLNKYQNHLETRLAGMDPASPEGQRMQAELDAVKGKIEAGDTKIPISTSKWNDIAQRTYGDEYAGKTGMNADGAYQAVTQAKNPEAYWDRNVLANDPAKVPFNPAAAEQTASVSPYKTFHNHEMAERGHITNGDAIQEDARGYAKDMGSKTIRLLESDPNVDPAKLDRLRAIQQVFEDVGSGKIPPGQIDGALQRAVPDIPGLTADQAMRMADANLEAGIKMRGAGEPGPTGSRLGGAFGRTTDAATIADYTQRNIEAGMDPAEATAVATAQTMAGNAAVASGLADPRTSMAGGALLPGGLSNILPDQAVENTVGTTYQAGSAAVKDLADSLQSGELSTENIDNFAESVVNRPGIDPFRGIGESSQLLGEEWSRSDGSFSGMTSNLADDVSRIIETGAGTDVALESMENFQQGIAEGSGGAPLQGLDHLARIGSDLAVDPSTTLGEFANDLSNIYNHGVGDGYWEESRQHMEDVVTRTPLVGTVASGYREIAEGMGESGVVGFGQEMAEGAAALAGEGMDAAANAARNTAGFIYNFFGGGS